MYRAHGPQEIQPVGETEFVNGVAAMSASGTMAAARCAGIVGHVDLQHWRARTKEVLEAHIEAGGDRFRGIRHSPVWDPDPALQAPYEVPPGRDGRPRASARVFAHLAPMGMSFDAWLYHTQISGLAALAQTFPTPRSC